MSVASLAGYLNNGGGGGGDTFEKIYIGESGIDVELSCAINNKLNVLGMTTTGVDIYNNAGDARVKLTCLNDNVLDVNNMITYTVEIVNENTSSDTVILNCESDNTLSIGNLKIADTGITFPDGTTQTVAYTGGGGGGAVDSIIAGDGISITPSNGTGNVTITSTVNPTDYLTTTDAVSTYQPLATMNEYVTATLADATFQTQADMADYLTTTAAGTTYQTIAGMANYSTTLEADGLYSPLAVTSSKSLQTSTPLIPVGTVYNIFSGQQTGLEVGTYIYSIYITIQSYDAQGTLGNFMGSGQIGFFTFPTESPANEKAIASQAFVQGGAPSQLLPVSLSGIVSVGLNSSFYINVLVDSLAQGGTQYRVRQPDISESPTITFLKIR